MSAIFRLPERRLLAGLRQEQAAIASLRYQVIVINFLLSDGRSDLITRPIGKKKKFDHNSPFLCCYTTSGSSSCNHFFFCRPVQNNNNRTELMQFPPTFCRALEIELLRNGALPWRRLTGSTIGDEGLPRKFLWVVLIFPGRWVIALKHASNGEKQSCICGSMQDCEKYPIWFESLLTFMIKL